MYDKLSRMTHAGLLCVKSIARIPEEVEESPEAFVEWAGEDQGKQARLGDAIDGAIRLRANLPNDDQQIRSDIRRILVGLTLGVAIFALSTIYFFFQHWSHANAIQPISDDIRAIKTDELPKLNSSLITQQNQLEEQSRQLGDNNRRTLYADLKNLLSMDRDTDHLFASPSECRQILNQAEVFNRGNESTKGYWALLATSLKLALRTLEASETHKAWGSIADYEAADLLGKLKQLKLEVNKFRETDDELQLEAILLLEQWAQASYGIWNNRLNNGEILARIQAHLIDPELIHLTDPELNGRLTDPDITQKVFNRFRKIQWEDDSVRSHVGRNIGFLFIEDLKQHVVEEIKNFSGTRKQNTDPPIQNFPRFKEIRDFLTEVKIHNEQLNSAIEGALVNSIANIDVVEGVLFVTNVWHGRESTQDILNRVKVHTNELNKKVPYGRITAFELELLISLLEWDWNQDFWTAEKWSIFKQNLERTLGLLWQLSKHTERSKNTIQVDEDSLRSKLPIIWVACLCPGGPNTSDQRLKEIVRVFESNALPPRERGIRDLRFSQPSTP